MATPLLPMTQAEVKDRGWDGLDVVLVTGDAYVDHPSYGTAVIGRVLEAAGFRVGVIAQPDFRTTRDLSRFGRPRLFFGITAGNVDSMVANYTAHKRPRLSDDYSPGGKPGLRPDHAAIVYANRAREAFRDVPIVLGGIEASLRRFAHYDWWKNEVRRSILLDSRADILVYGMGEAQVVEIARRLAAGENLHGIRGTAVVTAAGRTTSQVPCHTSQGTAQGQKTEFSPNAVSAISAFRNGKGETGNLKRVTCDLGLVVEIPSYEEVRGDIDKFNEAFRIVVENQDPFTGKTLAQGHANRFVIQYPPALPPDTKDLDAVYELPYARRCHPSYDRAGGVPGFETVRFSIISHRGCPGECSFCGLSLHQGRIVSSRSESSVLKEAGTLARRRDFRGTITDVGGPTANLYGAVCGRWQGKGACGTRHCLTPSPCRNLKPGYEKGLSLYGKLRALPGVKHVFIESGFRHDLLVDPKARGYLERICRDHLSGRMKVAPEHSSDRVLDIMNKPSFSVYEQFSALYHSICRKLGKDQHLVSYFISAHPGCTLEDSLSLALRLGELGIHPEQIQDFMPLPMTLSGTIYHTEKDPFTGKHVYVPKTFRERKMHRALIQYKNPKNTPLVREALKLLKKEYLLPRLMPGRKTV